MKGKSIVMLAVALGCGLVAMLGVQQVLSGKNKGQEETKTGQVLVAVQAISAGVPIDDAMVTFKEMPLEMIQPDSVTKPEEYVDRGLRVRAFPGTTILRAMLTEPGEFSVSNDIPSGMRVQAIAVDATSAVSGFVKPGDRVDIQVTYKKRTKGESVTRTKTVLEYIQVFAADKNREMDNDDSEGIYKNITVLVTPEQGNILRLAANMGDLHLSLRHPDDIVETDIDDFTSKMLDDQGTLAGDDGQPTGDQKQAAISDAERMRKLINEESIEEPKVAEKKTEPAEKKVEPKKIPTWTIIVYAGDEKIVHEIPLEEKKTETDETESGEEQPAELAPAA